MDETKEQAEEALALAEFLRERAVAVVSNAPYWKYVPNEHWAYVVIDGDIAFLQYFELTSAYDSSALEEMSIEFPTSLLFLSDSEFSHWKEVQKQAYELKRREDAEADIRKRMADREAFERAEYLRLKARFERQS